MNKKQGGGGMVPSRLVQARQKAAMTQAQVAQALMIPQQQYSRYENGKNEIPIRYVVALCRLYGVSADWLLGLTE